MPFDVGPMGFDAPGAAHGGTPATQFNLVRTASLKDGRQAMLRITRKPDPFLRAGRIVVHATLDETCGAVVNFGEHTMDTAARPNETGMWYCLQAHVTETCRRQGLATACFDAVGTLGCMIVCSEPGMPAGRTCAVIWAGRDRAARYWVARADCLGPVGPAPPPEPPPAIAPVGGLGRLLRLFRTATSGIPPQA